jgi:hypothetical protein
MEIGTLAAIPILGFPSLWGLRKLGVSGWWVLMLLVPLCGVAALYGSALMCFENGKWACP